MYVLAFLDSQPGGGCVFSERFLAEDFEKVNEEHAVGEVALEVLGRFNGPCVEFRVEPLEEGLAVGLSVKGLGWERVSHPWIFCQSRSSAMVALKPNVYRWEYQNRKFCWIVGIVEAALSLCVPVCLWNVSNAPPMPRFPQSYSQFPPNFLQFRSVEYKKVQLLSKLPSS